MNNSKNIENLSWSMPAIVTQIVFNEKKNQEKSLEWRSSTVLFMEQMNLITS